jgi:hypothetical protein
MKSIHTLPEADAEYQDALSVSPDPAAFHRDVNDALDSIARAIIVHRKLGRGNIRDCMLSRLPYSIVYSDESDSITIVAFAHRSVAEVTGNIAFARVDSDRTPRMRRSPCVS